MQTAVERRGARGATIAGATVKEVELPPIFEDAAAPIASCQDYEAFRALAFEYDRHRDRLRPGPARATR